MSAARSPRFDGGRRRFLDRLTLALHPAHAAHSARYEAAMRARNRLLGEASPDAGWRQADRGPATQQTTKKRRKRGGGRGRGEVAMVDDVEFTSYYGRQIV